MTDRKNILYIILRKRQDFPEEIIFEIPTFATYRGGELDFIAQGFNTGKCYCNEVKANNGNGASATKAITDGKADYLLRIIYVENMGFDQK